METLILTDAAPSIKVIQGGAIVVELAVGCSVGARKRGRPLRTANANYGRSLADIILHIIS
jgi:hypothetical protein